MTPTEQDEKLRRNICGIATGVLWGKNFNELTLNERSRVNAMAKDLEAYITADRKRVAREARLMELLLLREDYDISMDYEPIEKRIAELKAQQEEV